MEKIKVIIVDDSDFIREGMHIILNVDEEFEVIGTASNGKEALDILQQQSVDVVVMDIQMPIMDGIEATKEIVERDLGKVLILTTFDENDLVEKAIQNGAKGYLIKNHTPDKLKQMIKAIYNGVNVLDEKVFMKISSQSLHADTNFDASLYTAREMDIIESIAEGLSNKQIGEKLFITEGTVKNYISTILEKSQLMHRTQLAIYYLTGKK
ncbi:MAG: response regulator [Coprobacillaceae bacterium]